MIIDEAPSEGEDFDVVLNDVESKIMPGIVHWNHPGFFAYFPSGNSYPSILGDMLSSAIGSIGFSWVRYTCIINNYILIIENNEITTHFPYHSTNSKQYDDIFNFKK